MSVIVKGMKMPENCEECSIKAWDDYEGYYVCPFSKIMTLNIGRQNDCPFVEVHAHGDLIDLDERIDVIDVDYDRDTYVRTMTVAECLDKAGADRPSVIIEAEDRE